VFAGDVEEAFFAQILIDEEFRHVSPAHALQDQLSFHELIAYSPAAGALNHKIIARRCMPYSIADDALRVIAHLLRRDRTRYRKSQETGRHDGHDAHRKEIQKLQARIRFVDVMENKVGIPIEQTFPRSGDRLKMQMQTGARAIVEKAPQQASVCGNGHRSPITTRSSLSAPMASCTA